MERRLSQTQRYPRDPMPSIPLTFLQTPAIPSGPMFSFGKQKRALSQSSVYSPGPAAYISQIKAPIYRQPPSFAMGAKIKDILIQKEKNSVPGVGNYSFGSCLLRKGTVFGKANRECNSPQKKTSLSSASYSYSDAFKRIKSAQPAYSIPHTKKLLISDTIIQDKVRKTPGPGAYEMAIAKGVSYSFGNRLKGVFDQYCKTRCQMPGPGGYEIKIKAHEGKRAESFIFGTEQKFKKIKSTPGPGDYNIGRNYPSKSIIFQ